TLTPRWLSRRGLMLGGEFRYLSERSRGMLDGTWLPNDDLTGRDRGLGSWTHQTRFSSHWRLASRLQHVSDRAYFDDFGDSLASSTISLLESHVNLLGRGHGWEVGLRFRDWQAAALNVNEQREPYRELPPLPARWQHTLAPWAERAPRAGAVRFRRRLRRGGARLALRGGALQPRAARGRRPHRPAAAPEPALRRRRLVPDPAVLLALHRLVAGRRPGPARRRHPPQPQRADHEPGRRRLVRPRAELGRPRAAAHPGTAPVLPEGALPRAGRPAAVRHPAADLRLARPVPFQPLQRRRP